MKKRKLRFEFQWPVLLCLDLSENEEEAARLEEEEALYLQKKMAEQLDDQDFGLDFFKVDIPSISYLSPEHSCDNFFQN